jgi:recombination protein RecA
MAKKQKTFEDYLETYQDFIVNREEEKSFDPIETNYISFDVSTGIGGIPRYRWSNIWGPKSSGKTTFALFIVRQIIKSGGKAMYIDIEAGLDFRRIKNIIGDFEDDQFILIVPETSEQAFEIAESGIESNEFDLIIFDSVGALAPSKEKEDDFKDANVALVSRQLGKFLRRNSNALKFSKKTAFLFINQIRANIGVYYGDTITQPGGYQLEHFVSLEIRLFSPKKVKKGSDIIGTSTKFIISKNKCSIPFRTFELLIDLERGVDNHKDAIAFGLMIGAVERRGPAYFFGEIALGKGMDKAVKFLIDNEDVLDNIREMCYNLVMNKDIDKEDGA